MMPLRTCLGCLLIKDKGALFRFTVRDGVLRPDKRGVLGGRGAYICPERVCLEAAYNKKGSFSRTLKEKVGLPDIEEIWKEMTPSIKERQDR